MKNKINPLKVQAWVIGIGALLMAIKFIAHFITQSNAILSDALESIINVMAGCFAFYSLWLSKKPKDSNHPYGHGKIEFISAGFEGGMIIIAALFILFEAIHSFLVPPGVKNLDIGIYLVAFSGVINYILGFYLIKYGKMHHSDAMKADGKHLQTDTYTSLGLVAGLVLVYYTNLLWLDAIIAMLMGLLILTTGYGLIRKSLAGLMDEVDTDVISGLLPVFNENRKDNWIDMHNLRLVKYGSNFHIDAHVTLPWFYTLQQSHEEVTAIERLASEKFHEDVELFIHADPCLPFSCSICQLINCAERKHPFVKKLQWTMENTLKNEKHRV